MKLLPKITESKPEPESKEYEPGAWVSGNKQYITGLCEMACNNLENLEFRSLEQDAAFTYRLILGTPNHKSQIQHTVPIRGPVDVSRLKEGLESLNTKMDT